MKLLVLSSILIAVLFGALSCQNKTPGSEQKAIKIHLSADPASLDPALAEDGAALKILANTQLGLMRYNFEGVLEPWAMESYRVDAGGLNIEVKIKKDLYWSDGKKVLASHFEDGIKRSLSPDQSNKMLAFLKGIQEVRAISEDTLSFKLKKQDSLFLHLLTLTQTFAARTDKLQEWLSGKLSAGDYRIEKSQLDIGFTFAPNKPEFWPIELIIVKEESTAAHLFESGGLDILTKIPPMDFERVKKLGQLRRDPFYATYYIGFNTKKAPFSDLGLRQRIVHPFLKKEMSKEFVALTGGQDVPSVNWVPDIWVKKPIGNFAPLPPQMVFPQTVRLQTDVGVKNALVAERIQDWIKKSAGLNVEIETLDWKTHLQKLRSAPSEVFRLGWVSPVLDPYFALSVFKSDSPNNYTGWRDPEYDQVLEQLRELEPGEVRNELIRKAQEILLVKNSVILPLFQYQQLTVSSFNVLGARANPVGIILWRELKKKQGH